MNKYFRRIRRDICRWIVGFDNCPPCYQYNFLKKIITGIICLGVTFGILAFFFFLVIIC